MRRKKKNISLTKEEIESIKKVIESMNGTFLYETLDNISEEDSDVVCSFLDACEKIGIKSSIIDHFDLYYY